MARSGVFVAGTALALLALLAIPASAQPTPAPPLVFPPLCNCTRDGKKSPYRLNLDPPTTEGVYAKYCFSVENVGGCDPKYKCCNGQQGVDKIEFDVDLGCKDSLKRVTLDGNTRSFEYNTRLSVLRITNLNKTVADAPGTEVCIFLRADSNCTTLNDLCGLGGACKYAIFNGDRDCCPVRLVGAAPPPPSPSPPSPAPSNPPFTPAFFRKPPPSPSASFPRCNCLRNPAASRLTTTLSSVTPANLPKIANATKACFLIQGKSTCSLGSPCCQFTPYKFEVDADPTCSSSLLYSTVDGVQQVRSFQVSPYPAIKVTGLNNTFNAYAGMEVCVYLKPPCNTLKSLCSAHNGKCTVAVFNNPDEEQACCPLATV